MGINSLLGLKNGGLLSSGDAEKYSALHLKMQREMFEMEQKERDHNLQTRAINEHLARQYCKERRLNYKKTVEKLRKAFNGATK